MANEAGTAPAYWVEGPSTEYLQGGGDTLNVTELTSAQESATIISGSNLSVAEGTVWYSGQVATAATTGVISTLKVAGLGALAGGVALAAGSSSSSSGSSDDDDDSGVDASTTSSSSLVVDAAAGSFIGEVQVDIYDENGNSLYSGVQDLSSGAVSLDIGTDYTGPVLIVISDSNGDANDYIDETTGEETNLGDNTLRAMSVIGSTTVDTEVTVTPLTELATRLAGVSDDPTSDSFSITEEDVDVNTQVGELFGISDITGEVTTVDEGDDFDTSDGVSEAEAYGEVLAMLSGLDSSTGSIDATLDALVDSIEDTSTGDDSGSDDSGTTSEFTFSQDTLELLSTGVEEFNNGASDYSSEVTLELSNLITVPAFEIEVAEDGGINESEVSDGVNITLESDDITAGNIVTIYWGSQTEQVTITDSHIDDTTTPNTLTIPVSESTILAEEDGYVSVSLQVNEGELSDTSLTVKVDTSAPIVTDVEISGATGVVDNTLNTGDVVTVTVTMSEEVEIDIGDGAAPTIDLVIGSDPDTDTVQATYVSGSGTSELVFAYTIVDETDIDGISITANSLSSNRSTISDSSGNEASLTHSGTTDDSRYMVDTTAPKISSTATSSTGAENSYLNAGDVFSITVTMDDDTFVDTTDGTPSITLNIGNETVQANYASGSGTTELVFEYTISEGDSGAITVADNSLDTNGGTIQDSVGNDAIIASISVADPSLTADTSVPTITISDISISVDSGNDSADFLTNVASQTITAKLSAELSDNETLYASIDGGETWTEITDISTNTDTGTVTATWSGVTFTESSSIQFKVTDDAGNDGTVAEQAYTLDTTSPTIDNIVLSVPSDADNTVVVTVSMSEDVVVSEPAAITINVEGSEQTATYDADASTALRDPLINPPVHSHLLRAAQLDPPPLLRGVE